MASTQYIYLQGKCKWAKVVAPDPKYRVWSVQLYLTPDSVTKFLELKEKGVKTVMKKDEDGYFVTLRRPTEKLIRGRATAFTPPSVLDKEGKPMLKNIGNGSDLTVKVDFYTYKSPAGEAGAAIRMSAVRVDNLVEYVANRDMPEAEVKQIGAINEQPEQLF